MSDPSARPPADDRSAQEAEQERRRYADGLPDESAELASEAVEFEPAVFSVDFGGRRGTAFVLATPHPTGQQRIVTANHTLLGEGGAVADRVVLRRENPRQRTTEQFEAEVRFQDAGLDVAQLLSQDVPRGYLPLRLATLHTEVQQPTSCFVMGFPAGSDRIEYWPASALGAADGHLHVQLHQGSLVSLHGLSGAPVVTKRGGQYLVIGVIVSGPQIPDHSGRRTTSRGGNLRACRTNEIVGTWKDLSDDAQPLWSKEISPFQAHGPQLVATVRLPGGAEKEIIATTIKELADALSGYPSLASSLWDGRGLRSDIYQWVLNHQDRPLAEVASRLGDESDNYRILAFIGALDPFRMPRSVGVPITVEGLDAWARSALSDDEYSVANKVLNTIFRERLLIAASVYEGMNQLADVHQWWAGSVAAFDISAERLGGFGVDPAVLSGRRNETIAKAILAAVRTLRCDVHPSSAASCRDCTLATVAQAGTGGEFGDHLAACFIADHIELLERKGERALASDRHRQDELLAANASLDAKLSELHVLQVEANIKDGRIAELDAAVARAEAQVAEARQEAQRAAAGSDAFRQREAQSLKNLNVLERKVDRAVRVFVAGIAGALTLALALGIMLFPSIRRLVRIHPTAVTIGLFLASLISVAAAVAVHEKGYQISTQRPCPSARLMRLVRRRAFGPSSRDARIPATGHPSDLSGGSGPKV